MMTTCPQSTTSYCPCAPKVEMSSGFLCWRKHMPSMNPNHSPSYKTLEWVTVEAQTTESRHKMLQYLRLLIFSLSLRVCGSYADMNAGLPSEACKDFTGGVHMTYELHNAHSAGHDVELWNVLSRATECKSMICCGTAPGGVRTTFLGEHFLER